MVLASKSMAKSNCTKQYRDLQGETIDHQRSYPITVLWFLMLPEMAMRPKVCFIPKKGFLVES